jgi:hypothetical protein
MHQGSFHEIVCFGLIQEYIFFSICYIYKFSNGKKFQIFFPKITENTAAIFDQELISKTNFL